MRLPTPTHITRMMSTSTLPKPSVPLLISAKEAVAGLPNKRDIVALDVSWHMPNSPRSATEEFASGPRIPGARRFDMDKIADHDPKTNPLGLGHMLPTIETFRDAAGKLGITRHTHVVLYDSVGLFSAPRGLFTFKAFGHDKVSVLDGGLPAWIDEGGDVEQGPPEAFKTAEYENGHLDKEMVKSYADIVAINKDGDIVLDARSHGRFTGQDPEPRPGLSSGHMPHARSLPFGDLLLPVSDGHPYTSYKSPKELRQVLVRAVGGEEAWEALLNQGADVAGTAVERQLVFSCGSGMTACVGWLAAQIVAQEEGRVVPSAVYDESWTGYASRPESEIVKGE
ncbi:uncharacterized protein CcaverHIS019_0112610 [Cutaneotrichosporon cavernicola]|uniref:Rhodanese domain-containing protein n=1 Tax=Cutaneotrichosporon cavernicola TaxID=279322 RepID=A0AA48IEM5_9TREE|nr:uncharacterized protein CcaverHIS019_0112610 [Cutaneotrichosporon cavernicola]BEI88543.1 hypothetical protein CcaverHIS019_0112610 [Cutaneotrichosporon cavernicola]BEI96316.1 hypothetical protein CcaverHIS631_0112650 [Cutaneotrichosporon cavernicola]BEJ04087.1 hypothetical protein CcaverHIS641_0112620 [Cutaneotrichosporon cavernicola]